MAQNTAADVAQMETGTTATLTYKHPVSGNTMTKEVEVVENTHVQDHTDHNDVQVQWEDAKTRRATITSSGSLRIKNSRNTHRTDEWELTNVETPENDEDEDDDSPEVGDEVEPVGDKAHYSLSGTWEILMETEDGYRLANKDHTETLTVKESEIAQ